MARIPGQTKGNSEMVDEQRADNEGTARFVLDEGPFDHGVRIKVVGIGHDAAKVVDQLRCSSFRDSDLILIEGENSLLQQADLTNEADDSTAPDHATLAADQLAARIAGANFVVIVARLSEESAELIRTVGVLSRATVAWVIAFVITGPECTDEPARERAARALTTLQDVANVLIHLPMSDYRRLTPQAATQSAIEEVVSRALAQTVRTLLLPVTDSHRNMLNVDFRDFYQLFRRESKLALAVGCGYGADRATEAALAALGEEGLLFGGVPLSGATAIWLVIEGGDDLMLSEIDDLMTRVREWVGEDTFVLFTCYSVPDMDMKMRVTILAAGHERFGFQSPPDYHARVDLAEYLRNAAEMLALSKRGEQRARELIAQLLPDQAERYREGEFIEADSGLFAGAHYRIHLNRPSYCTDLIANQRPIATFCMTLRNRRLPPSDRVLAEYFLIRGDEEGYLKTANIKRKEATGPQDELILARLFQGEPQ